MDRPVVLAIAVAVGLGLSAFSWGLGHHHSIEPIVIIMPGPDDPALADKAARCAQVLEGAQAVNDLCLRRLRVCLGVPP